MELEGKLPSILLILQDLMKEKYKPQETALIQPGHHYYET
jgi:hypothetical protein